MKRLVSVFVLLVAAAAGAYYYFNVYSKPAEKPTVAMATLSTGPITEIVQTTGTLEATRTMSIGSQVSGMVKEIYVDFNSIVHKGDLLAEIDPDLLQVQVTLQEANVARQEGEIANQEVQLEDAKRQLERAQMLFDKQLATQQQLDQAQLTVKTRTTALDAARRQLQTVMANLDQAKLNVSYTKIYAPIDGVIVNRTVDRGQFVQSSMTAPTFFTIATDTRQMRLSAGVDESEIGKIQRGMQVNFRVDAYPTSRFSGTVEQVRLNATTQSNVVTYPVWITVSNPDYRLRPYMTAQIEIVVNQKMNVLRIPNQATRFRPTADMYTALGLTPPPPQQGRAAGAGRNGGAEAPGAPGSAPAEVAGAGREGAAAARGGQAAGQAPAAGAGRQGQAGAGTGAGAQMRQGQADGAQAFGQGRRGQGGQGFGQGQGRQGGRGTGQFGANGFGGRNGGAGGRGRNGGAAQQALAPTPEGVDKIDDLYTPVPVRIQTVTVYQWDEANKKLTDKRVQIGIADSQFSELVSGDLKAGDQVVTNIVLPVSAAQRQQQNQNIFQQGGNQRGGFGAGGPGGGGFTGGGGGGGRGGGGGGR